MRRRPNPVNRRERNLMRALTPGPRKRRPVKCLRCGLPTERRLNNEIGICESCEPEGK